MKAITPRQFQQSILKWFDQHGRTHLPWQQNKTPYRVWVSEIMLQQTQVNTVIPYFNRFMEKFPTLLALAHAKEDEVLHLWSGLGYYSRARHLHRAAILIANDWQGCFPQTLAELIRLPGIGPSTAGAILAIAFNQAATILDGNVKRVLARFHHITSPITEKKTETELWQLAKRYTPSKRIADYTQAMMDLGATLCVRGKPDCPVCPLANHCAAHAEGDAAELPVKASAKALPVRAATFLIFKQNRCILLYKRPDKGIWGGLFSLPEITGRPRQSSIRRYCLEHFQFTPDDCRRLDAFRHTFSHYHLDIFPVLIETKTIKIKNMEGVERIWYKLDGRNPIGIPKPVQTLLQGFI